MEDLPQTTSLDYIPIDQFLQENDKKNKNTSYKPDNSNMDSIIKKLHTLEEKNRFLESQVLELKLNSKELVKVLKMIRDTLDKYFTEERIDGYSER